MKNIKKWVIFISILIFTFFIYFFSFKNNIIIDNSSLEVSTQSKINFIEPTNKKLEPVIEKINFSIWYNLFFLKTLLVVINALITTCFFYLAYNSYHINNWITFLNFILDIQVDFFMKDLWGHFLKWDFYILQKYQIRMDFNPNYIDLQRTKIANDAFFVSNKVNIINSKSILTMGAISILFGASLFVLNKIDAVLSNIS